jgi:hypothetical protein
MPKYATWGQVPAPIAALVPCKTCATSTWATCHCNPRYYGNVHATSNAEGIEYDEIVDRREDFKTLAAAEKWAKARARNW